MTYRIVAVGALIAFLVLASNGYVHRWLGLDPVNGTQAGFISSGGTDLRSVEGWATATYASELCGFKATEDATDQRSADWDGDPQARRMIGEVRKQIRTTAKDKFCKDAWAAFGPGGSKVADLLTRATQ